MAWELEGTILFNIGNCVVGNGPNVKHRRRPLAAVSLIQLRQGGRQKAGNMPSSLVSNFHSMECDPRPRDTEGGHLVGVQLGGTNATENIVPMYSHVNRGTFSAAENAIVSAYVAGQKQGVIVELGYHGTDGRIPSSILLRHVRGLAIDTMGYRFDHEIRNWPLANAPAANSRIDIDPNIHARLLEAKAAVDKGWKLEDSVPEAKNWAQRGWLPPADSRPYALLDWIHFEGTNPALSTDAAGTIGPGLAFSPVQRDLVQKVNRYLQPDARRGECWSDAGDDPVKHALIDLGADTGVEIDHIVPKASSGTNAFSNARVTSASYNRSKGRSTD